MISFYKKECGYRKWQNEKKSHIEQVVHRNMIQHIGLKKLSLLAYVPHGTTGLSK